MGSSRKVNILIDVEDDVYFSVVKPYKEAKIFSKLMATLLQAYLENDELRSDIDEAMGNMKKAQVNSLDNIIENMQSSLSSMGMFTDMLSSNNKKGTSLFKGGKFSATNVVGKNSGSKTPSNGIFPDLESQSMSSETPDPNVDNLKDQVNTLEAKVDAISKSNSDMMSMLKEFMGTLKENTLSVEETNSGYETPSIIKESNINSMNESIIDESELGLGNESFEDDSSVEIDDYTSNADMDLMKSLMSGNNISFDF